MKDFAALLLIYSNRVLHEFLCDNLLQGALPSLRTVQRHIAGYVSAPLMDPGFCIPRINAAVNYFQLHGYHCNFVHIAHDAVHILSRLSFRFTDGALLGFAIPDGELYKTLVTAPSTFEELRHAADTYPLASQAEVFLLVPLDPRVPAYIIGVFAQTAAPCAADVLCRVDTLTDYLLKAGIAPVAYCAVGRTPAASDEIACCERDRVCAS